MGITVARTRRWSEARETLKGSEDHSRHGSYSLGATLLSPRELDIEKTADLTKDLTCDEMLEVLKRVKATPEGLSITQRMLYNRLTTRDEATVLKDRVDGYRGDAAVQRLFMD